MNARQLIVAAILAATGPAFAQNSEFVAPDAGFKSTKSRAEVMAELSQAKDPAMATSQEYTYPVIKSNGATIGSRAELRGMTPSAARSPSDLYYGA